MGGSRGIRNRRSRGLDRSRLYRELDPSRLRRRLHLSRLRRKFHPSGRRRKLHPSRLRRERAGRRGRGRRVGGLTGTQLTTGQWSPRPQISLSAGRGTVGHEGGLEHVLGAFGVGDGWGLREVLITAYAEITDW